MIQMQFAINKDNFKGERTVTCFSCHRGAHEPVGTPIIPEDEPKHTETAKAPESGMPTAEQVIDKYIQAVGGADALQKVTSRSEKGTINTGGRQIPIEVLAKAPDKRISIMHTPNGDSITAYDGQHGWLGNPGGRPPRDMSSAEADAARLDADFNLPVDLKKIFTQFRVRPGEKIGEHETVQLIGIRQGMAPVRLYFDKESGLLLRMARYADTPLGRNPTQIDYADYRAEGGVKIPFRWTLARPLGRFTIQVDQVQQNIAIDDAKFSKPAGGVEQKPAQ
jgi:outer membrane lipoprotein-sorting protein